MEKPKQNFRPYSGKGGLPSKLAHPRSKNTLIRERLCLSLDQCREHYSAIWLSAPAGSGKTTLVGDYLAQRKLRSIWYQVDEGDNDTASFFHYLGLAAAKVGSKSGGKLPHLTPEYIAGLPTFSQRFFETLVGRLKPPFVIVLDNYQELATDSPLHELLALAIELLPQGITLIVISRVDCPTNFVRLRANGQLSLLGWEALRLTAKESFDVAQLRGHAALDNTALQKLYELTDGWAAGLTLALEQIGSGLASRPSATTPQAVFDYFAAEIFDRSDAPIRELLLHTAFLPYVTVEMAQQLSGNQSAGKILADLQRRNYFTYRQDASERVQYQYHPLFREFLIKQAVVVFDQSTLDVLRHRSAALLENSGDIDDAIALYIATESWRDLTRNILQHAPQLLQQGRSQTLALWLRALPNALLEADGWLQYWYGSCRLAFAPAEARVYFENAFSLFERDSNVAAQYETWASIVDTFMYEWGDFKPLDRWIETLEKLLAAYPDIPASSIAVRVAASMLTAGAYRQPWREDLPYWAERVQRVVLTSHDVPLRMALAGPLIFYYLWVGDFSQIAPVVAALRAVVGIETYDPLTKQNWYCLVAMYSWFAADWFAWKNAIEGGVANAKESGVHLLDLFLMAQGVYGAITLGDAVAADVYLKKMIDINSPRLGDRALLHYQMSSVAWIQGDWAGAIKHGEQTISITDEMGWPTAKMLCLGELAGTLFDGGRVDEAKAVMAEAKKIPISAASFKFMNSINEARFAFEQGDIQQGRERLNFGFCVGRQYGFLNLPRWNNQTMAVLCAKALAFGIETEYARQLIKKRSLPPPPEALLLDAWPWPIKIYTLGRFAVELDGAPLQFSGRVQQKPLDLLKAIITLGEPDVAMAAVVEELWPNSKGNAGEDALAIALHRLRTLLGKNDSILLRNNRLSLNPAMIWLDVDVFEHLTDQATIPENEMKRLFDLYRGPFLAQEPDEPWLWPRRERLRSKLLRYIMRSGRAMMEQQRYGDAVALYEQGLDVDALAEEFYSSLMRAHIALGQRNEALSVYRRCEKTLGAMLGVRPSPETEAIYRTLRD